MTKRICLTVKTREGVAGRENPATRSGCTVNSCSARTRGRPFSRAFRMFPSRSERDLDGNRRPVPWDRRFRQGQGISDWIQLAAWETVQATVPNSPGGYVVVRDAEGAPAWGPGYDHVPAVAAPYRPHELVTKWAEGHSPTLYIGQGGHLRQRLDQLIRQPDRTRRGLEGNHRGGRALWQATDWPAFWLGWCVLPGPASAQAREFDQLIQVRAIHGGLPVANWR